MKVQLNMPQKNEVLHVARLLKIRPDEATGMIIRFWAWAQQQTDDGLIEGIGPDDIDLVISQPGFAQAMLSAGWLQANDKGIHIPDFYRHNSKGAKARALANERKARERGDK